MVSGSTSSPGLLSDLTDHGVGDALSDLHASAGDRPQLVVGPAVQQDAAGLIHDDG
jgi:hypothetical protein